MKIIKLNVKENMKRNKRDIIRDLEKLENQNQELQEQQINTEHSMKFWVGEFVKENEYCKSLNNKIVNEQLEKEYYKNSKLEAFKTLFGIRNFLH